MKTGALFVSQLAMAHSGSQGTKTVPFVAAAQPKAAESSRFPPPTKSIGIRRCL
jgi:hypothetical protein